MQPTTFASPDAERQARYVAGPTAITCEASKLRGQAGARGIVRGRARVIFSPHKATDLRAGDILVAPTTAPPWTPLFASVVAVVTDTGGILSHGAVVAREYRIPAVVGTRHATTHIREGQLIEVDGDAGIVRLL